MPRVPQVSQEEAFAVAVAFAVHTSSCRRQEKAASVHGHVHDGRHIQRIEQQHGHEPRASEAALAFVAALAAADQHRRNNRRPSSSEEEEDRQRQQQRQQRAGHY